MVRLSDKQFNNIVAEHFTLPAEVPFLETPGGSPDAFVEPLDTLSVGTTVASQLQLIGETLGDHAEVSPAEVGYTCGDAVAGSPCVQAWLQTFVGRALRRPLSPEEMADYSQLFDVGSDRGGASGAALVIEALLQSPSFFYHTELGAVPGEGSLAGDVSDPNAAPLTPHELAASISLWLVNSLPDDDLWQAAEDGSIQDPDVLRGLVRRIAETDRAKATLEEAILRWFGLTSVLHAEKDAERFPEFSGLRESLLESARLSVSDALFHRDDLIQGLYGATEMYVNDEIAPLFGLALASPEMVLTSVPPGERVGLLTHPAFMARYSTPSETQVVQRGLLVRREALCQELPPPPEGLDIESAGEGLTEREFAEYRASQPGCVSCHSRIDPFGLMFEVYDPIGRYRSEIEGTSIETAGQILGTDFDGSVAGPVELAGALSQSDMAAECFAHRMLSLAQARTLEHSSCGMEEVAPAFLEGSRSLLPLIERIALSRAFRTRSH